MQQLINEVKEYDYIILDDGSDCDLSFVNRKNIIRLPHGGKNNFWKIYNLAIKIMLASPFDNFLFLQDDTHNVDFDRIKEMFDRFKYENYLINARRDERTACWSAPKFKAKTHQDLLHYGFFDCVGFTNRKTLSGFKLQEPDLRFKKENTSSGVGYQITKHFNKINIPMYTPVKSLVTHGNHESKMHPNERIKNKLITL